MRRFTAAAIAALLVAGPVFATELEMKKKREDAAKEEAEAKKAETAKAAEPTPAACQDKAAPPVGTAGFFQTVEDIYGFEGQVAALAPTAPSPAALPAVVPAGPVATTPAATPAAPAAATPPTPVAQGKAPAEKPKAD